MYLHLTNVQSPVDATDGAFLELLKDYRIGPPIRTWQHSRKKMIAAGVFGVYAQGVSVQVRKLTGFTNGSLSPYPLGANIFQLIYLYLWRHLHG